MSRRVVLLVAASFSCTRPNPLFSLTDGSEVADDDDDDDAATVAGEGDSLGPTTGGPGTTGDPGGTTGADDPTGGDAGSTGGLTDPGLTATSEPTGGSDTCDADCPAPDDECLGGLECSGKLEWLRRSGDAAAQRAADAAVLSDGSVVVVGEFAGEIGAAPDVITTTADPLAGDGFILRLGPAGEQAWIRQIGGDGLQRASAVVALPDDRIAVAGRFAGQLVLGPHQIDGVGAGPAFVAILDADGGTATVHILGGDDVAALDLAATPDGHLVVAGRYAGDILVAGDKHSSVDLDIFAIGLDPGSGPEWSWAPADVADQSAHAVAVAPSGDIFVAGELETGLHIGDINLLGQGIDGFVAGLDPGGVPQWGARIGGPGDDRARALAAGPDGTFVVAGVHGGGLDFGEGSLPDPGGELGGYVASFDAKGGLRWARSGFVLGADAPGVAIDPTGRVVVALPTGEQPIDLGGGALGGAPGLLLVKLTGAGHFVWGRHFVGDVAPVGAGLGVGVAGEIAVAGAFDPSLSHDPLAVMSAGELDIFAGRLLP